MSYLNDCRAREEALKRKKDIVVLGIESSCDETAAAVVKNGRELLSSAVYSQIDVHKVYGGVVPEIASRAHVEKIETIVQEALEQAGLQLSQIDAIAVTFGPGLVGALLVGVSYAKALAYALKKPLIAVNHIEGHICANYLCYPDLQPPFLGLVVSGGHSHIFYVDEKDNYSLIGCTQDDAAGEAFDKIARVMQLPYPGGPKLDEIAETGDDSCLKLPKPSTKGKYDFSFSGLKTAFINICHKDTQLGKKIPVADYAASFRKAIVESLVEKTILAARDRKVEKIVLAGGVSANRLLRRRMEEECKKIKAALYMPRLSLCGDNAAMIAACAARKLSAEEFAGLELNACPSLRLFKCE